jgi:hypothetical protein
VQICLHDGSHPWYPNVSQSSCLSSYTNKGRASRRTAHVVSRLSLPYAILECIFLYPGITHFRSRISKYTAFLGKSRSLENHCPLVKMYIQDRESGALISRIVAHASSVLCFYSLWREHLIVGWWRELSSAFTIFVSDRVYIRDIQVGPEYRGRCRFRWVLCIPSALGMSTWNLDPASGLTVTLRIYAQLLLIGLG